MGLSEARLLAATPSAQTEFGHVLESFVVNEVLKQIGWADEILSAAHYRTHDGTEVDLVIERDDGSVVGLEVKGGGRVSAADRAGLRRLRDRLGERFLGGVILYAGANEYTAEDRIHVVAVEALWR